MRGIAIPGGAEWSFQKTHYFLCSFYSNPKFNIIYLKKIKNKKLLNIQINTKTKKNGAQTYSIMELQTRFSF